MQFVIIIVIVVALVAYVAISSSKKQKASSWDGEVVDKTVRKSDDGPDAFRVTFSTSAGDTVKLTVNKGLYDSLNVGDKVVKNAGQKYPEKV